jgi:type II secretory pathway pseudopilin PulG
MQCRCKDAGFSLVETMLAMVLVAFAMTGVVLAFASSGKFGVLSRRQANAVALARSIAGQLNVAAYTDARLVNNNTQNDTNFADPNGVFARPTLPASGDPDAPDNALGTFNVGVESYDVYVNVAPLMDPVNITLEQGRQFAVIVRYRVGDQKTNDNVWMRAVVLGYRYNPTNMGVGALPL